MTWTERITFDPVAMGGEPSIRHLRAKVGTIVGPIAAGRTAQEILKAYWNLNDWRARLAGRFRNEHGAHAGFTAAELESRLAASLPPAENKSFAYHRALYSSRLAALSCLDTTAYIESSTLPCISRAEADDSRRAPL